MGFEKYKFAPETIARQKDLDPQSKMYESEIGPIKVSWQKFLPKEKGKAEEGAKNKATLFLPGIGIEAGYSSIKELNQSFADYGHVPAYSVFVRPERPGQPDSLQREAEAVIQFIEENHLDEITLAGHSQGGDRSINIANTIQEKHPNVKVRGLILMDSPGLYEQSSKEIKSKFFKDALIETPKSVATREGFNSSFRKRSLGVGTEILFTALKEAWRSKTGFLKRVRGYAGELAKFNEGVEKIQCPIVLIQGEKDLVSDVNKIIPDKEQAKDREEYLKKSLFKKSPYVKMLIAKKLGHHGVPFYRSESVAKTALYMIERSERPEKGEDSELAEDFIE
jgi:pimeloyl-ACP methyl ester carboxylesterase